MGLDTKRWLGAGVWVSGVSVLGTDSLPFFPFNEVQCCNCINYKLTIATCQRCGRYYCNVFMNDLANQEFREFLHRSGWSQAEAARQLNLTPAAVSRYLSGASRPSASILKLCGLLLEGAGIQVGRGEFAGMTAELDADEADLIRRLRSLPGRDRSKVLMSMRLFLEVAGQGKGSSSVGRGSDRAE